MYAQTRTLIPLLFSLASVWFIRLPPSTAAPTAAPAAPILPTSAPETPIVPAAAPASPTLPTAATTSPTLPSAAPAIPILPTCRATFTQRNDEDWPEEDDELPVSGWLEEVPRPDDWTPRAEDCVNAPNPRNASSNKLGRRPRPNLLVLAALAAWTVVIAVALSFLIRCMTAHPRTLPTAAPALILPMFRATFPNNEDWPEEDDELW